MTETAKTILVIGGGIAGPALAAAVADAGYRTILIERSADPLDTARGDHLQPFTCEALQRWGVLDAMFERGAERRLGSRWPSPVIVTPASASMRAKPKSVRYKFAEPSSSRFAGLTSL